MGRWQSGRLRQTVNLVLTARWFKSIPAHHKTICTSSETGKRKQLKIIRQKCHYEFESHLAHHFNKIEHRDVAQFGRAGADMRLVVGSSPSIPI